MALIASDVNRLSNLVKLYDTPNNPYLFNDILTANEAAQTTYKVGTVLGKVTASGKYIVSKQAASDGSQNPVAVVIGDGVNGFAADFTVSAATDTKVLAITRGKVVLSDGALQLDSSFSTNAQKQAAYASLKAQGILVETSI